MNENEVNRALNAAVHRGFLVPEWYHDEHPDATGLRIVYHVGGITLPIVIFTFGKAFRHSLENYRQRKLLNTYILMVSSLPARGWDLGPPTCPEWENSLLSFSQPRTPKSLLACPRAWK